MTAMTMRDEPSSILPPAAVGDARQTEGDALTREAHDWIVRFMAGTMTGAEIEAMKAWYRQDAEHAAAYARARAMWDALGPIASADDPRPLAAAHGRASARVGRRLFLGGAVAASAAYLVVRPPLALWPSYAELAADYRTGAGEQRRVELADLVSLDLNTRTSIAVRSQQVDAARIELISGEAMVSTGQRSAPLTIIAGSGRVVATSAEFNLRCDGSSASIACLKGGLLVEQDARAVNLRAGQQVAYDGRGIGAVTETDPEMVTAWRSGLLIFDATPVAQVIAEVNRYRAGRVVLLNDAIGRRLLTARVKTTETDLVIAEIKQIFGANARTLPGGIVLLT